jgi:hypothetical protein
MSNFFKKAVGLFVEFEPENDKPAFSNDEHLPQQSRSVSHTVSSSASPGLSQADMDKFSKHFEDLFDKANLPGPDYYEFWKMMETLEAAVPDEKVRMAAVYATLKVQGLSKDTLLSSAGQYQKVIQSDKLEFQNAVNNKVLNEVQGRKNLIDDLEKSNNSNAERIRQLTEEITANQSKITALKKEIIDEEDKINVNQNGYNIACDAMISMIANDVQKINNNL